MHLAKFLFSNWESLIRVLIVGVLTYAGVVVMLRIFGNRTLSKLAAFDQVATVAVGSALATSILSRQTPLFEGLCGVLILVLLQFGIAYAISRSRLLHEIVTEKPKVIVYQGEILPEGMKAARLARTDLHAILRKGGIRNLEDAELVVLESDGSFSSLAIDDSRELGVLAGLEDQLRPNEGTAQARPLVSK